MNNIKIKIEKPRSWWNPLRWFRLKKKIVYKRKTPSEWKELTADQLRLVAKVMLRVEESQINNKLILSFLKIPPRHLNLMNLSQLDSIAASLDFIFDKNAMMFNRFHTIKQSGFYWDGPKDKLSDITFSQFVFADTLFLQYTKNQERTTLLQLIACLWLPRGANFEPTKIESNAKLLKKLPEDISLMMLFFYIGSRSNIVNAHPHLFPKSNTQSKSSSSFSWSDTVFELVGDKPADKGKIDTLNIYFALGWLNRKAKDNKAKQNNKSHAKKA